MGLWQHPLGPQAHQSICLPSCDISRNLNTCANVFNSLPSLANCRAKGVGDVCCVLWSEPQLIRHVRQGHGKASKWARPTLQSALRREGLSSPSYINIHQSLLKPSYLLITTPTLYLIPRYIILKPPLSHVQSTHLHNAESQSSRRELRLQVWPPRHHCP